MLEDISTIIMPQEFTYKSVKNGHVRLMTKSTSAYRTVVKYLDIKKKMFHTYQLKQERAYRVVVKNLHHTTPPHEIKTAIEKEGHNVRNVMNVRSRISKQPMSIFFVDLEPKANNSDVYKIKYIGNAVIKIEAPLKSNDIVQCQRCQGHGHTRKYCRYTPFCVKCGLNHLSSECKKDKKDPPKCVNCQGEHPANYRGCTAYKSLLQLRSQQKRQNIRPVIDREILRNPNEDCNESSPNSYAGILKNNEQTTFGKIEELLNKQIELTHTLLNMMSLLISKLCN